MKKWLECLFNVIIQSESLLAKHWVKLQFFLENRLVKNRRFFYKSSDYFVCFSLSIFTVLMNIIL